MRKGNSRAWGRFGMQLLAGVSLCCLMAPGFAWAQDATATTPDDESEVVVVTGSRIPRPNLEQPTPVSTIDQDFIENSGTANLGDIIAQLPALSFSGTVRANANAGADIGGLNLPDLRDLGTSRTLTLVDGKRHVAGDAGDSAVDLGSIPPALVDRVEVTTGGASAIYGSDAVSGVINIITKRDFSGVSADIEYGAPTQGGYGQQYSANATFGQNFNDGRGNVTLSFFYDHQSAVNANDIRSLNNYGSIINDASPGLPGNGIPDALLVPNVLSEYIDENGVIVDVAVAGDPSYNNGVVTAFTNGGAPVPQPSRIADNSFAFGQFAGPCATCFALEDWEILYPKSNRAGGAIGFDYDITSAIHYHFDGKYVESHIADNYQPAFSFFEYALDPDNAFITPQIQSALDAATLADPGAAFYVNRFLGDLGGRSEEITRSTWRIVNDFSGDIDTAFADLKWDLSYVNSQTQNRFVSHGDRILGNFFAAIDAVVDPSDNQIKCRVDVPSAWYPGYTPPDGMTDEPCVPYNLFGQQNSQAAIEYITYTALRKHTIGQEFFDGTLNFDTSKFFNLPGGPVGVAVGFEYREEESQNINDAFVKSGLAETAAQPDAVGGFHVSEGFVETYLPIVMHKPFMEELSLDLAGRWADYTPFGGTNAWKAGGVWAPFRDLSFRATYGRAVRAPNITEAFLPTTATFFGYSDPCDSDNINNDPDRDANCQALLGIGAGGFDAHDNITTQGSASGNVHLKPEESTSWTAGVILQPRWTPGLAITLDYYNIDIEDAISFVSAQSILNNCVDSPGGPDLAYCDLVDRDPTTHDVTFIRSQYVNASRLKTAGWDMTLTYRTPVDGLTSHLGPLRALDGDLNVNMTVNYTDDLRFFAFQDQPEDYSVYEGTIGDPEIKLLSRIAYRQGPLTVGWESRFMSKVTRFSRSPGRLGPESISPAYVEPQWYHDITAQFDVGSRYQVYGGVNNVFDEEPPLGIVQGDGSDASYDLIGRFVFVGFRAHY